MAWFSELWFAVCGPPPGPPPALRVVSWNVLAHIHTHWNAAGHGGAEKSLEGATQRDSRHANAVRALRHLNPDVALLQECDAFFLPPEWTSNRPLPCGERLPGYTAYASFGERGDGCVVLLKDAVFEPALEVFALPASRELGGKASVVVRARRIGSCDHTEHPLAFASLHLRWGAVAERRALLGLVLEKLGSGRRILGGDFNAHPADECWPSIERTLASSGMERVATPAGTPTGLDSKLQWDATHAIDHVFASRTLLRTAAAKIAIGPLPRRSVRGPWGPRKTWPHAKPEHDGSDHAWLHVHFELSQADNDDSESPSPSSPTSGAVFTWESAEGSSPATPAELI